MENKIKEALKKQQVTFIRLLFTDLVGRLKSVEVPSIRIDDVLSNRIKCDGSSIEGLARIIESDMILSPDLKTFRILPYEQGVDGAIAIFICNVLSFDGRPNSCDPRTILINNLKALEEFGFKDFNIGFEPEFYLLKENDFSDHGSYFDLAPFDLLADLRRAITMELIKCGFDVEAAHHEVGPGQHEITFHFTDALTACDNIQLLKLIVRNVAARHQVRATFMPKFRQGYPGSGLHVNMSITDQQGRNVFAVENKLSELGNNFINGLLAHAAEICFITNPTINSYKRLHSGFEAPCYISYSHHNRSTLVRIPAIINNNARAELRMVDPSCNPYLAIAVILQAGLAGIRNQIHSYQPVDADIYLLSDEERAALLVERLPADLKSALDLAKNSFLVHQTVGKKVLDKLINLKEREIRKLFLYVTELEKEMYLDI